MAAGGGIAQAAREGRVTAGQDFSRAADHLQGNEAFVAQQLAKLGPGADAVRAATATEAGTSRDILGQTLMSALEDLRQRQERAPEAAAFTINKALQDFAGTSSKVGDQLTQLAGEQGAFASQRSDQLNQQARAEDITLRGQDLGHEDRQATAAESRRQHDIDAALKKADQDLKAANAGETARHHRATEKAAAGKPKGKTLTPGQKATQIDQIKQARDVFRQGISQGVSPAKIKQAMATGTPNVKGAQGTPKIPADLAQAGWELVKQSGIGPNTAKRLARSRKLVVPKELLLRGSAPVVPRGVTFRGSAAVK